MLSPTQWSQPVTYYIVTSSHSLHCTSHYLLFSVLSTCLLPIFPELEYKLQASRSLVCFVHCLLPTTKHSDCSLLLLNVCPPNGWLQSPDFTENPAFSDFTYERWMGSGVKLPGSIWVDNNYLLLYICFLVCHLRGTVIGDLVEL